MSGGIALLKARAFSSTSGTERGPTSTEITAGWPSANCSAAAVRGTPWRAHGLHAGCAPDQVRRGRLVVVQRSRPRFGEQAAVEGGGGDDPHAALEARRQQLGPGALLEQGVAASHQYEVEVEPVNQPGEHLVLVHPHADRPDHPLGAQLGQRRIGGGVDIGLARVGVVEVQDVDAVEPQALEAPCIERRIPSREKSQTRLSGALVAKPSGETLSPGPSGASSRPTLVEST